MKIYAKRVGRVVSLITFVLAIFFGIRAYRQHLHTDYVAVQTYNEWRNQMLGVQNYLGSNGPGEKPRGIFDNPNMALITAQTISQAAAAMAGEASMVLPGQVGTDFSYMAGISGNLQQEMGDMIDHGTYVKGTYRFTQSTRVSIADRNYMYRQLTQSILAGLPMTVTSVGQIKALNSRLNTLSNPNFKIGVFSDSFVTFMKSTGQFK